MFEYFEEKKAPVRGSFETFTSSLPGYVEIMIQIDLLILSPTAGGKSIFYFASPGVHQQIVWKKKRVDKKKRTDSQ